MSPSDASGDDADLPDETAEATPIFGTVMVLWFLAFGLGTAYISVTRYLGGWPLLSVQVLGLAGATIVCFTVVGIVANRITWRSSTLPEETPWKLRPAWRSSTIEEDLYFRTVSPSSAARFAVAGWAVGGVVLYFSYWRPENPDPGVLFFLIIPLAFSVPTVLCLRRTWHRWTYGTSTLVMETMPGRLGHPLNLRLQTPVAPSEARDDTVHVKLTCYHRSPHRRASGNVSVSWIQKWETETEVHEYFSSEAQSGTASDGNMVIPISFDLPADTPPSTPEKKRERIAWILEVSAEMEDLDYASYFEIPVFEPETADAPDAESEDGSGPLKGSASPHTSTASSSPEESGPMPTEKGHPLASSSHESPSEPIDEAIESDTEDSSGDAETVRCDNCSSVLDPTASECPACGTDLRANWFS